MDLFELALRVHHHFHGPSVNYAGLGVAAVLSWVGLPGPGEAALIGAGVLAAKGRVDLAEVLLIAWAGAMTGGLAGWALGFRFGRTLVTAGRPLRRVRLRSLNRAEGFYERFGPIAVFFTPTWMAGVVKMRWSRFLPATAIASLVWSVGLGVGAYFIGPAVGRFIQDLGLYGGIAAGAALALAVGLGMRRRQLRARAFPGPQHPPVDAPARVVDVGERTTYDDGIFCWVELSTSDPDAAKEFYSGLFGWEYDDIPVGEHHVYSLAQLDGKVVAAMQRLMTEDAPPNWLNYVATGDADAATAKAKELGGQEIVAPFDVMEAGRMAVLADPQGAVFALWQGRARQGLDVVNTAGSLTWNQLMTPDLDAAEKFYGQLFGWSAERIEESEQPYMVWMQGDLRNGGAMLLPPEAPAPPHWLPYFGHADLDAAKVTVEELRGTVMVEPMSVPAGRFLVATDPQGVFFALFEGEMDD